MSAHTFRYVVPKEAPFQERLAASYVPEPNSGCWLWVASLSGGRPIIHEDGRRLKAHRLMLAKKLGAIPAGKLACHTCHEPLCVNPDHLYAGTQQDNVDDMMHAGRHFSHVNAPALAALRRRAAEHSRKRGERRVCEHGHPFDEANTYVSPGSKKRACRICRARRRRESRAKRRTAR